METEKKPPVLNNEQREAAYCANNAVIAAGAGSGKTMVLASRFAWLVTEKKYRVREILTLTFTKKAAAQMYRRIHLLLAEIAGEDTGEKGKLAQQALDEFTGARIQTLDSYSASIVRQAANRYGLNPEFSIDENRCLQLALDEALPFLVANRNHPAIERLYLQKSPVSIARDLFASTLFRFTHIDSPPDPKRDFTGQYTVVCGEWERQSGIINEKLRELAEGYSGNENYHPDLAPLLGLYSAGKAVFPAGKELRDFFAGLVTFPHRSVTEWAESHPLQREMINCLSFVSLLASLDMRKGSPRKNPIKDILHEIHDLFGEFSSLAVFCIQAGLIYSILTLLSELQLRYLDRKRAGGILTFSDAARLARTILLEQKDIRQSEKESFKAIMIDEFQDNNELQKDLLFLLAENENVANNSVPPAKDLSPGKLFFVGDEKQSIYRFRGADVSVFRKLKNELGGKDLPLKVNYRSAPLLIGAFNSIFGGSRFDPEGKSPLAEKPAVFAPDLKPPDASPLPPYEASFSPLEAHKTNGGKLTLCILDKQDPSAGESAGDFDEGDGRLSPVENEARYIAERIDRLLKEKNETGGQKYRPHDIAILFRSRSPQHLFEKHLMLLNIPYASEDLNGFFYGGPVNDLMSVLRLVAYPADKAAYAQMLRSPFAGLSLSGLAICLAAPQEKPFDDEPLSRLSEEDRSKYSQGQRIYKKILDHAGTESVSSLVSELWYGEGYRYETEWNPKTAAYRELYDYLFHLAALADEEDRGLAAFVDSIQDLDKNGERLKDIEIPLERPGAVHLLTIHKSKGLEFPVVFICCCDKRGRNEYSDDIFDTGETGLTLNPPLPSGCDTIKDVKRNYFWERSLAAEKGKRTAELRRLLYVGMTRAENELYLSGCLGINKCPGPEGKDVSKEQTAGDFSLALRQYIDKQTEKTTGRNSIKGDAIHEGNTFFGLCLPAFGASIRANTPEEGPEAPALYDAAPSFFDIEEIPAYSEKYIREAEKSGSRFSNDQEGLNSFFKIAELFYRGRNTIETPGIPKNRFTPTSLPRNAPLTEKVFAVNGEYSGDSAREIFARVDKLLARYGKKDGEDSEKFDSGSFGTIAHICAEALLAGREAVIPPKLAGFLSPADAGVFLEAGKELALGFSRSLLGRIAGKAVQRKSEYPFRSLVYGAGGEEIFISGTIDLVFEDSEAVYVVDFKTDSTELPDLHIVQMACYYRAASDLFALPSGKKCRVWLYYLRSGHAVEVTNQARDYHPEQLVLWP